MKMSKAEQKQQTMQKLIEVAREVFSRQGYADAAMEDIVKQAGVTRGALYHHFGNKEGLFEAVLASVQQEIGERVEAEAAKSEEPWQQLILGCLAFVSSAVEHRNKRILLIDGPSVIGWETWRRMDEENSMRHLREQLQTMQEQGYLRTVSIDALTHLLSGAMNEAVLWISETPDHEKSLEEISAALTLLLEGYRTQ
ncbi:TetR/AcrR family transcriptional regulator [Brevibacillus sp. MER 51]|uniref:TetR/AcrR family transcriptional regulator n=1 Tax=Brevibacillus sp. MER 51 TaxID=2939560 RepID=UPI00203B42D2|nr:TetR/AcrR family transcriptional regulator [Brevibacillus sp. MER 51]MCM3142102.1 TetR/AcrR family transcriptional regulator [Brevibacillus sp. MER 51]